MTEEEEESATAALRAAEHAWDVRAAELAFADDDGPARPASLLRGGPAEPGERTRRQWPLYPGKLPAHDSAQGRQALADLIDGRVDALLFVEFTPDRINVIKAVTDAYGIPRQNDAGTTKWASAVPSLDRRPEFLRFQLAGGIGTLPVPGRRDFDTAVTRWLREFVPPPYARSIVLVNRRSGWALLDRAVALLRAAYPPRAELGPAPAVPDGAPGTDTTDTRDAVREALRTAPLRADHTLLLARVDQGTGAVRTHAHVLFPAGSRLRPGETATAEITVFGGPADRVPVVLPVLAAAGRDGSGTVVLSARQTALTAFAPARLAFVLRGPGEVTLAGPETGAPGTGAPSRPAAGRPDGGATDSAAGCPPADVSALVGRLPRGIIRPPALEVVLTVEMSGAEPAETAERLAFAQEFIAALARRPGSGRSLRVGVVGHYDHVVHENSYTPRSVLLLTVPPGPATAARSALAGWRPARREQDTASSLEDALRKVRLTMAGTDNAPHPRAERAVLIVGRRPPGLPEQHDVVPSCPLGADWRTELNSLRARGVRVMARLDRAQPHVDGPASPVQRYTAAAWDTLSAGRPFLRGKDSAASVADALAPAWRWDGPPCRLALATPLL
ncbi:hypothetical protein OOK13_09365 [Streptomyces sp. NBC_00378]|uniref:hypothetical protein n=1 Tax=unclassified Streptomyces TaxID=2593676 RepID=UPI0022546FC0|nr:MULTISPECIES: hypothetical protein [unclassified Streptomyces]MCX5108738.1 hypothetical protein [Streptomyces sp. NBC_00378]